MGIKLARKEYVDKETNYSQVYNDWGLKGSVKKCKGMTIVHVEGEGIKNVLYGLRS